MVSHFYVAETDQLVVVKQRTHMLFSSVRLFIDNIEIHQFALRDTSYRLNKKELPSGSHVVSIVAAYGAAGADYQVIEKYIIQIKKDANSSLRPSFETFKPGDILIASDNINGLPPGYMGHSAIVIDEENLIESVMVDPSIYQDTIEQFFQDHTFYAHYRPVSAEMGEKAAEWAKQYLEKYEENKSKGINKPVFSFFKINSLKEPWEVIYCSKLVWLSYYYGANYKFHNDYLWFAPQDLEEVLSKDPHFKLIYKHPKYKFKLDL